jgi:hypothetical protein
MKGLVSRIWRNIHWILLFKGVVLISAGVALGTLSDSISMDYVGSFLFIVGIAMLVVAIGRIPVMAGVAVVDIEIDQRRKRKPTPEAEKVVKPRKARKAKKEEAEAVPEGVSWDI